MAKKSSKAKKPPLKVPQPVINTVVPALVGFAVGATIFENVPLGMLVAIVFGALGFFFLGKRIEEAARAIPSKTPADVLRHALAHTVFLEVETHDERRPEAISIDGERWSQIMRFTMPDGEQDVFMVRGSLVTGESRLEYVDGLSKHFPSHWETTPPEGWDDPESSPIEVSPEPLPPLAPESTVITDENMVTDDPEKAPQMPDKVQEISEPTVETEYVAREFVESSEGSALGEVEDSQVPLFISPEETVEDVAPQFTSTEEPTAENAPADPGDDVWDDPDLWGEEQKN